MGATDFCTFAKGKTAQEAFESARAQAQYDYGHAGYTGTIAEKDSFVMVQTGLDPTKDKIGRKVAMEHALKLLDDENHPASDKYGPAGCITLGDGEYLFFGFASS